MNTEQTQTKNDLARIRDIIDQRIYEIKQPVFNQYRFTALRNLVLLTMILWVVKGAAVIT